MTDYGGGWGRVWGPATLAGIALGTLGWGTTAWAQAGAGRPGGPARAAVRLPFAVGTVSAVDSAAGTLTLKPLFGRAAPIIRVTSATQITARSTAKVGDLKVGDSLQVQGLPTSITAARLTAGDDPAPPPAAPPAPPRPDGAAAPKPTGPPPLSAQAAFAQASGKITALDPLTLSVADGVTVTLKVAPDAKITRYAPIKLTDIKPGDRILAAGQPADDGSLTATRLRVNADGGFGRL